MGKSAWRRAIKKQRRALTLELRVLKGESPRRTEIQSEIRRLAREQQNISKNAGIPLWERLKVEWAAKVKARVVKPPRVRKTKTRVLSADWNEHLARMPYAEYLETPEWQARRKAKLAEAEHRCQLCNRGGLIDIHHRTYERRGNERLSDLIALCRKCHSMFHGLAN